MHDELNAALPHILAAPKDKAAIEKLCYRPNFGEREYPDSLSLCSDRGVIGDRWLEKSWLKLEDGSSDPRNQICILGKRTLDLIWRDRANVIYPGDNMIADFDFSESNLPSGTELQIGEAVLRVSDVFNDACTKWKARYGAASREWINAPENVPHRLRGVFCQIIHGGEVRLDDELKKV